MAKILVLGVNHKTAPIDIREKFFCSLPQQELLLSEIKNRPSTVEVLILSTCNRTEIYSHSIDVEKDSQELLKLLFQVKGLPVTEGLKKYFYLHYDEQAIRHLLKVTSGLDSMILGEKQILGQVKESVELSRRKATIGKYFNILTNMAIRTAHKAHTETRISAGGSSLSWAAVMLAEKIYGSLNGKTVLIMGAGKMSELALQQLKKKGVKTFYVMNRTQSCAFELAQACGGQAVSFADIKEILSLTDLCICSVGAPHYILEAGTVEKVMAGRTERKLAFIDISMPRNIDPMVTNVNNTLLFHLDDLEKVVFETMQKRQEAAQQVEKIIEQKIQEFYQKIAKLKQANAADYFETISS